MEKLIEAARENRMSLGVLEVTASPEVVETVAYAGFDWVCIDMMFESTDWSLAANMVRAAKASGTTPIIRVASNPWVAPDDPHVLVEITRAIGIGAMGVLVSLDTPEMVTKAVAVSHEWHRNIHIMPFADDMERYSEVQEDMHDNTLLVPLLESENAIENMEAFFEIEGLKAIGLGISDVSRMLGHPFDYEHPDVWAVVDRAAGLAKERGIYLFGNTGYQYQDVQSISERVKRLHDHGVRMILLQSTGALLQFFCQRLVAASRAEVEAG